MKSYDNSKASKKFTYLDANVAIDWLKKQIDFNTGKR